MQGRWMASALCALCALALGACEPTVTGTSVAREGAALQKLGAEYQVPAEWEPHASVWAAWWVFPYGGDEHPTEATVVELVQSLAPFVPVDLAVQSLEEQALAADALAAAGVDLERVGFHVLSHNDFWFRDTAGVFARNQSGEIRMLDWGYDTWSYDSYTSDYSQHDERIDRDIAERLGVPAVRCSMIHEGGNVDVDGHGTAMVTETVARRRNPGMTLDEMDREIRRCYGVKQVIWVPDGTIEDQAIMRGMLPGGVLNPGGTDGHVDAFVRFAPNNTILLAEIRKADIDRPDPGEKKRALANKKRLDAAYKVLSKAKDAQGKPYQIVRMPVAPPDYYVLDPGDPWHDVIMSLSPLEDGTELDPNAPLQIVSTTSYLNFFVSNGVVLMPSYETTIPTPLSKAKDAEAYEKLALAFPGRTVVKQHHVLGANRGAGGTHCLTQQQPVSTNAGGL